MRRLLVLLVASTMGVGVAGAAECRSFDTVAAQLLTSTARTSPIVALSESCLCSLLGQSPQARASTVVPIIRAFAQYNHIDDTLLFCAWRLQLQLKSPSVFAALIHAWKQYHSSLSAEALRMQQNGDFGGIDTLCAIFDNEGALDAPMLLRWIEAKQVLDDHAPVPGLLCRVISGRPELTWHALNLFETFLGAGTAQHVDTLMEQFTGCAFTGTKADTNSIRSWIIEQYGRRRLFSRQFELLSTLEKNTARRCEQILSLARQHLMLGQYATAAAGAAMVFKSASERNLQENASSLLYQAYRALGINDSAKMWLERSGLVSEKSRLEAIELYQNLGDYSKAAGLFPLLQQSISRDTLYLRQLLLRDSLQAALCFINDRTAALSRSANDLLLWRVRTALYAGKTGECLELLDSGKLNPAHPNAPELMEYRYWLLRLADVSEALAKFIQIEYTLFKGNREKAAQLLCSSGPMGGNAWRMAVRIARRQIDNSEAAAAAATLRCAPAEQEAEYVYCLAEALLLDGKGKAARSLLERLILDFPESIYTVRGRLLLSQAP